MKGLNQQSTFPLTPLPEEHTMQKPKKLPKILVIASVLSIIVLGIGAYLVNTRKNQSNPSSNIQQKIASSPTVADRGEVTAISSKLYYFDILKSDEDYETILYEEGFEKNTIGKEKIITLPADSGGMIVNLQFSPDRAYLGWSKEFSHEPAYIQYIAFKNEKNVESKKITINNAQIQDFAFSPDSQQMAILEQVRVDDMNSIDRYKIRIVSLENGATLREFSFLQPGNHIPMGFIWSKSNKLRAIFSTRVPSDINWLADFVSISYTPKGNKEFERVIHTGSYNNRPNFAISEDGENVAFVTVSSSPELVYGDINGTNISKLVTIPKDECTSSNVTSISPDKRYITIGSSCLANQSSKIFDTKKMELLDTEITFQDSIWTPDSKYMWVKYYSREGSTAYILSSTGRIIKKMDMEKTYPVIWK
ncbi:MAG TPA: hypothetical protein PLD54_00150 [Candidatus Levybacteria bacterium]|nr:hypothetical protein [Candidatus Levybacteria bacterium]